MAINLTQGAAREKIDAPNVAALRNTGVLIEDPRRERPRYFDGRFLSARDLTRDQQYFLTREADLGRSAGSGVAHGLFVTPGGTPHALQVSAGQGVTPAGELVLIPHDMKINLADVPVAEMLSAKFGLSRIAVAPLRSRTGLFVLALRPVEFTANPIGAYPTSLTGPRTVEDGDVIEATALVLVPYQDDGGADALEARRGRAARAIFTQGTQNVASANVLPIAMLALQSNSIVWIDEALVRRELGADRGDLPGLGFAPRALRLAHLLQHQTHLADVVAQMHGRNFAAATQFPALPPAGPLPPGTIDTRDFTQRYFPAEVDVDFSIIPEDELPALIEEALALAPIDFLASEAALDLTAVLVLAPVPRSDYRAVMAKLESRRRVLKASAPNLVAQRKPLEILQRLRLPPPFVLPDVSNPADAEWARLANLPTLWYVRRRNLAYRDDLVGNGVAATGRDEIALEDAVRGRIKQLELYPQFDAVLAKTTTKAAWSVMSLLALPRLVESPALTAAALGALSSKAAASRSGRLDNADVLAVGVYLNTPGVGDGLVILERSTIGGVAVPALTSLASNDAWRTLDTAAVATPVANLANLVARFEPMSTIKAGGVAPVSVSIPTATIVADKLATTLVTDNVATTPVVDKLATTLVTDKVATTPVVDKVATTPVVDKVATAPVVDKVATAPVVDKLATTLVVDKLATTLVADKLATTLVADRLSTTMLTGKVIAKKSAATVASKPVSPAKSSKLAAAAKKATAKSAAVKKPAAKAPTAKTPAAKKPAAKKPAK